MYAEIVVDFFLMMKIFQLGAGKHLCLKNPEKQGILNNQHNILPDKNQSYTKFKISNLYIIIIIWPNYYI